MSVSVLNTTAGLSGKTLALLEGSQTFTGQKTFDVGASAPFVVVSGAAKVSNLDADKLDGLDGAAYAVLANAAAFLSTLSVAGALSPLALVDISGASAGQIKFPAAQNASTNANTLDDYEEGVWTPVIGGSGGTSGQAYTTQVGVYGKIGKLVVCQFRVQLSTLGTITTNVQIQGLPFTSENTTNQSASLHIGYWLNLTTALSKMGGELAPNATAATVRATGAAATSLSALAQADLANTTYLDGFIAYRATA